MSLAALLDVPAPAKLNLFLHIVGRRADGYHLLQSAFVLLDWCDLLHFERRSDGRLVRHDLGQPLPEDDLCLRAALGLQRASGSSLGADISVDKRLPWGAGLGGGSSDAATTLLALNRLWGLNWPRQRLQPLALSLGADVPFFIGGDNAWVEGVGEQLTPISLPQQWLAVVKPAQSIATAAVFSQAKLKRYSDPVILTNFLASIQHSGNLSRQGGNAARMSKGLSAICGFGRNDLQPAAEQLCPQVAQVAHWLAARFGNSRMSGSGSAVFASAGTGSQPLVTWLANELPPAWVGRMCRSLTSHPLRAWAD